MVTERKRCECYTIDGVVMNDCGIILTPLDDDYYATKQELENITNPLSDDYCKYYNE